MKTVSGKVVSTKPVSISKAANILSKFASSDNGASPAFVAYLKRASASFDELAQLHKKHKRSGGGHKVKRSKEITTPQKVKAKVKGNISVTNHVEIEENNRAKRVREETERINVDEQEKHKSKKRKKRSKEEGGDMN